MPLKSSQLYSGRLDTVAREDDVGPRDRGGVGDVLRPGHHIVSPLEAEGLGALYEGQGTGLGGRDADQRDLLDVRPVRVTRLEAQVAELGLEIRHGELLAAGAWRPSLELVGRQHFDVLKDGFGIDGREGRHGWTGRR